jgi:hypothetical protein
VLIRANGGHLQYFLSFQLFLNLAIDTSGLLHQMLFRLVLSKLGWHLLALACFYLILPLSSDIKGLEILSLRCANF